MGSFVLNFVDNQMEDSYIYDGYTSTLFSSLKSIDGLNVILGSSRKGRVLDCFNEYL